MKNKLLPTSIFFGLLLIFAVASQADYLIVPHAAFRPDCYWAKYDIGNTYVYSPIEPGTYVMAPVYLPDKAEIQGITLVYYDNGEKNFFMDLRMNDIFENTCRALFNVNTDAGGNADSVRSASDYVINEGYDGIVDTSRKSYWLIGIIPPGGEYSVALYRIYGVRIEYKLKKDK